VQRMLVFDDHPALEELRKVDVNSLTPIQALNILSELRSKADNEYS